MYLFPRIKLFSLLPATGMFILFLVSAATVRGQETPKTGITGIVSDGKEPMEGATITLIETKQVVLSGTKGEYTFHLKPGTYTLQIHFVGFKELVRRVTVEPGQLRRLVLTLSTDSKMLGAVSVQANRRATTERALLEMRKNSTNIQDAIGAVQIEKTASITTAQALQRVTGVTVKDGKYITVRGLSDRNVVVQLNGSRLAGADASRSSVAVDLIPAQLLENIIVEKSITPDKPGDANGAVVEINTKSIPENKFLFVSAQTGVNGNIGIGGYANSFRDANMGFFGQRVKNLDLTTDYRNLLTDYTAAGYSIPQGTIGDGFKQGIGGSSTDKIHYTEALRINRVMEQGFSPYLTTTPGKVPVDQIYGITYGNKYPVHGKHTVGLILGVNYYNRSQSNPDGHNNLYSVREPTASSSGAGIPNIIYPNEQRMLSIYQLHENTGNHQLNYGGLATLAYRFNPFNEISLTYNGNFGTETNASQQDGISNASLRIANPAVLPIFPDHQHLYNFILRSTERSLNSYQFRGEHKFRFDKKMRPWQLSYSFNRAYARQNDPDYRDTRMRMDSLGRIPNPNNFQNPNAAGPQYVSSEYQYTYFASSNRYYRNLTEQNANYKADLSMPFRLYGKQESILKAGGYYYGRSRDYRETLFTRNDNSSPARDGNGIIKPNPYGAYPQEVGNLTTLGGNLDAWSAPGLIGVRENANTTDGSGMTAGYLYVPQAGITTIGNSGQIFINSYHATVDITAFYAMADLNLPAGWRVVGGVRVENTSFQSTPDTTNTSFSTLTGVVDKESFIRQYVTNYLTYDWLPSGSLIYKGIKNVNFRAAYSKTLIRPEMNEIVLSAQRDPIQQLTIYGNKSLKNGIFSNYDFRTDWFIGKDELVSASLFYKTVDNQLERVYTNSSIDQYGFQNSFVSFRNNPLQGKVYGLEFEVRKDLHQLFPMGKYILIGGNLMLAKSETTIDPTEYYVLSLLNRNASRTRPLVDQPNYSLNVNIDFDYPKWGTQVNALYNRTGKRLSDINADGSPNIYEYPAPTMDLVWSQAITKKLQFKAFVKNLLNSTTYYRYTEPGTTKTYGVDNREYIRRSFNYGSVFTLGLKYTF